MSRDAQLALAVHLRPDASFANFVPGGNSDAARMLEASATGAGEQQLLIYGPQGEGKSHLLQASCHAAASTGRRAACMDLTTAGIAPEVLEGWDGHELLCLDAVDAIAGDLAWERALFVLLQERRDAGATTLIAMRAPIAGACFGMPELTTRLAWGPVIALRALDDEARIAAFQQRATARGLDLPDETARYLLVRVQRNMVQLDALLDRLDTASLAAQRKLTVPFVREVLAAGD